MVHISPPKLLHRLFIALGCTPRCHFVANMEEEARRRRARLLALKAQPSKDAAEPVDEPAQEEEESHSGTKRARPDDADESTSKRRASFPCLSLLTLSAMQRAHLSQLRAAQPGAAGRRRARARL